MIQQDKVKAIVYDYANGMLFMCCGGYCALRLMGKLFQIMGVG